MPNSSIQETAGSLIARQVRRWCMRLEPHRPGSTAAPPAASLGNPGRTEMVIARGNAKKEDTG
jgi:hypothetical protein